MSFIVCKECSPLGWAFEGEYLRIDSGAVLPQSQGMGLELYSRPLDYYSDENPGQCKLHPIDNYRLINIGRAILISAVERSARALPFYRIGKLAYILRRVVETPDISPPELPAVVDATYIVPPIRLAFDRLIALPLHMQAAT